MPETPTITADIADFKARAKQLEEDRDRQAIKIEQLFDFMSGIKCI